MNSIGVSKNPLNDGNYRARFVYIFRSLSGRKRICVFIFTPFIIFGCRVVILQYQMENIFPVPFQLFSLYDALNRRIQLNLFLRPRILRSKINGAVTTTLWKTKYRSENGSMKLNKVYPDTDPMCRNFSPTEQENQVN